MATKSTDSTEKKNKNKVRLGVKEICPEMHGNEIPNLNSY